MSSIAFNMEADHLHNPVRAAQTCALHHRGPHAFWNTPVSNAQFLSAGCLFCFMFSFWHGKTKSVTVNMELQWDMHLTRSKYLLLAKANKTKVQWASKPARINVTVPGNRGVQRTLMKSMCSRGSGKRRWRCIPKGACGNTFEKQPGQHKTPGSYVSCMLSGLLSQCPLPGFWELIKGSLTSPGGRASLQQLTVTITYASLY